MILPDPYGRELLPLADGWVNCLQNYGFTERLDHEDDWQDWASSLVHLVSVSRKSRGPLPSPYAYQDWLPWFTAAKAILDA